MGRFSRRKDRLVCRETTTGRPEQSDYVKRSATENQPMVMFYVYLRRFLLLFRCNRSTGHRSPGIRALNVRCQPRDLSGPRLRGGKNQMTTRGLFVVRRCDGFYRFWHDVMAPAPLREAQAVYDRLTSDGTHSTAPNSAEYYDIFATDPLPEWTAGSAPLIRRLHPGRPAGDRDASSGARPQRPSTPVVLRSDRRPGRCVPMRKTSTGAAG